MVYYDKYLVGVIEMPLQTKRNDVLSKQFDEMFDIPDLQDNQKDRFLGKQEQEDLQQ